MILVYTYNKRVRRRSIETVHTTIRYQLVVLCWNIEMLFLLEYVHIVISEKRDDSTFV